MDKSQLDFLTENASRAKRWEQVTEGIAKPQVKNLVECILDITKANLRTDEDTDTSNIAVFTKFAQPLIRRIFPQLIANQISSIQPMKQPTMKVFYQDFEYSDSIAPTVKGDRIDWQAGKHNPLYASGVTKGEAVGTGNGTITDFNLKYFPLKSGTLTVYKDSVVVTTYTINEATGLIHFATAPANAAVITADYAVDLEQVGSVGNSRIAGIELTLTGATVEAEEKRLAARWTTNAQQDFKAYFDGDLEGELTKQLGDEAAREIDRLVISDMFAGASAGNVNWASTVPTGVKVSDHYESLIHAIADASMNIYRKRLRHANFIICSPDVINLLDKTNRFVLATGMGADGFSNLAQIQSGPNVFGALSSRYTVITDPMFTANKILVGYKGADWNETGYVFAPYTSFYTETFTNPETMRPVKGLATRFGRHLVNGDFYATVTIT